MAHPSVNKSGTNILLALTVLGLSGLGKASAHRPSHLLHPHASQQSWHRRRRGVDAAFPLWSSELWKFQIWQSHHASQSFHWVASLCAILPHRASGWTRNEPYGPNSTLTYTLQQPPICHWGCLRCICPFTCKRKRCQFWISYSVKTPSHLSHSPQLRCTQLHCCYSAECRVYLPHFQLTVSWDLLYSINFQWDLENRTLVFMEVLPK